LQSLWFKYKNALITCKNCNNQWYDDLNEITLKRVDFIWVNRDFHEFEWFIELLGELELQQLSLEEEFGIKSNRFLNIYLYMTSAKIEQEIMLHPDQLDDRMRKSVYKNGVIMKNIQGFSLNMRPGRPDLKQVSFFNEKTIIIVRGSDLINCFIV